MLYKNLTKQNDTLCSVHFKMGSVWPPKNNLSLKQQKKISGQTQQIHLIVLFEPHNSRRSTSVPCHKHTQSRVWFGNSDLTYCTRWVPSETGKNAKINKSRYIEGSLLYFFPVTTRMSPIFSLGSIYYTKAFANYSLEVLLFRIKEAGIFLRSS